MTAAADYRAYILAQSPIAFWTFDGLAPGALQDVSGNGHGLTGSGTFTLNNPMGQMDGFTAAQLDGATAFFTPAGGNLHTALFTVVAIVWPTAGDSHIFSTETTAVFTTAGFAAIVGDAGHNFALGVRTDAPSGGITVIDSKSFGSYGIGPVQLSVTYDGVNLQASVNGGIVAASLDSTYVPGTTQALIGRSANGGKFFKGLISDLAVFDKAIPTSVVAQASATAGLQGALSAPQVIDLLNRILNSVQKVF